MSFKPEIATAGLNTGRRFTAAAYPGVARALISFGMNTNARIMIAVSAIRNIVRVRYVCSGLYAAAAAAYVGHSVTLTIIYAGLAVVHLPDRSTGH